MQATQINYKEYKEGTKYVMEDFAHLPELREFMVHGPIEFCIERGRLLTRFLKEKGGLDYADPMTRQAEALKYMLENKKANVFPHELLAGSCTSKRRGVLFYPEFLGGGIWPELLSISVRKKNRYNLTIKEILELDQEILPFWMDKNVPELVRRRLGDDDKSYQLQELLFLYMVSKYNCQSHTIPDYKRVLEKGLEGLIKEAENKLKSAKGEEAIYYKALITVMEGTIIYSNNLAKEAERQAEECENDLRRAQLIKMAERCKKVPAKPAGGFWEAVQSLWTVKNALDQEQNNVGFSIGRYDQLLNPFYVSDIEKGVITKKEAIEILAHFWLKVGDNVPMVPEAAEQLFGGSGSNQAITIGGCDKDGVNAVNEMTFLCLDVTELVHIRDPNVNARVRIDDPPEYTERFTEVIINTGSTPSLIDDEATIPSLESTGVSLRDARDYAVVGCVEPSSSGRHFGHTGAILINLIAPLELVFKNGDSLRRADVGLKTGELSDFKTYNEFLNAVKTQLKFIIDHSVNLNNVCGEVYKYAHPQPLLGAIFEGPLESGKSLLNGGATYNSSGIAFIAIADLIDSLYAVKTLVYDEKRITLEELVDALNTNFKNNESLYSYVINKLDHFGNGVQKVDIIGREMVDFLFNYCQNKKNYRGGPYNPGYWSMTVHSGFGKITGAFPHGKKKGQPLASGATPVSFGQREGPTAVLKSVTYLDNVKMPNGMALNLKFNKSLFNNPEKLQLAVNLIRSYMGHGGMQIQFTVQDVKTLIDAKAHPEKYPDLMVRISGYTAYFVDLNESMMDEIINRAIMDL